MIYGIGHDIVENQRISYLFNTYGQNFVKRILSSKEQENFTWQKNKVHFLAKRFAAKEAFAKACGTGLRAPILLSYISIINNDLGKPEFRFDLLITTWLKQKQIKSAHLSLSDEVNLSSAFVILEY